MRVIKVGTSIVWGHSTMDSDVTHFAALIVLSFLSGSFTTSPRSVFYLLVLLVGLRSMVMLLVARWFVVAQWFLLRLSRAQLIFTSFHIW